MVTRAVWVWVLAGGGREKEPREVEGEGQEQGTGARHQRRGDSLRISPVFREIGHEGV